MKKNALNEKNAPTLSGCSIDNTGFVKIEKQVYNEI